MNINMNTNINNNKIKIMIISMKININININNILGINSRKPKNFKNFIPFHPTPISLECRAMTAADLPSNCDDSNR